MATKNLSREITREYLNSRLNYDVSTGKLTWLEFAPKGGVWNGRYAGKPAGGLNSDGYVTISIDGVRYLAHRIIWLMVKGEWPPSDLDHRDENKSNNRIGNLRPASRSNNMANRGMNANNSSGFKGVHLFKATGKWQSTITVLGKQKHLGFHDTPEKAALAYDHAARLHFGEFAVTNFPRNSS